MTSRPELEPHPTRRHYLDWARGLAVLVMIHAHVLDAWTAQTERKTLAFGYLNVLGGFAAPLFLWLAGFSLMLSAARALAGGQSRSAAARVIVRRGLEIFLLAFVFRAQSFIVSPGNPLVSLLRVDILNIMGPSIVVAAWLWRVSPGQRTAAWLCAVFGAGLAMVTPLVRAAAWVSDLPPAVEWYITPSGNHSTFTLLPWAGFVFAGAACGAALAAANRFHEGRALAWVAVVGVLMALFSYGLSHRSSIYPSSSFWTTSPTYFGLRVGILMMVVSLLYATTPLSLWMPAAWHVLARFGRHSLFVYWIHVELVYGYATIPVHHRLPLWATGVAYVIFAALMYGSIGMRDRVVRWWQSGPRRPRLSGAPQVGDTV